MPKTIPFSFLPLEKMKQVSAPFIGIGNRLEKAFPFLKTQLKQAEIDASPQEYASIMAFNFVVYFLMFSVIGTALLSRFLTNRYINLGVLIPENFLVGIAVGLIVGFLVIVQMSMYPKMRIRKKVRDIEANLVYALRTMLVEIKSGTTLFDSLNMIAKGKYGRLSDEIGKAVDEINAGVPEENALQKIATENPSPYLKKVVWQLVNGMKAGADVSDVIGESVDSMTRQQEIEIQRYGSSLRVLSLMYLMIGVIIPALGLTFLIVLGSFPKIQITEQLFWTLLGFVILSEFMYLGMLKSKRPNLMSV